jgi:hypothetical protein
MRRLTALFLLAAVFQSAGCVPFEPTVYSDADGNVVVAPRKVEVTEKKKRVIQGKRRYKDVPIPRGYGIDYGQSRRYQRSGFRKVSLLYRQSHYAGETRDRAFVKRYYTRAGWKLKFVYGLDASKFIFHKGSEECRVEVKQNLRRHYTEIKIEIEPRRTPSGAMVARSTPRTVKASKKTK